MAKIQIITIIVNILFLFYIAKLIVKGKLREEYAIVWCVATAVLLLFSLWAKGLDILSKIFGVYEPTNLLFTGFIFIILIYLLHLSVVNSKLQRNMTRLTQELALMKQKLEEKNEA